MLDYIGTIYVLRNKTAGGKEEKPINTVCAWFPNGFCSCFSGERLLLSYNQTISSHTVHSLWAGGSCYKLEMLCVVIHEKYCTCSQISKSQQILCHSDIHNSYQLVSYFIFCSNSGGNWFCLIPSRNLNISTIVSEINFYNVKLWYNPQETRGLI